MPANDEWGEEEEEEFHIDQDLCVRAHPVGDSVSRRELNAIKLLAIAYNSNRLDGWLH